MNYREGQAYGERCFWHEALYDYDYEALSHGRLLRIIAHYCALCVSSLL
jgi:hypothetical protein